MLDTTTIMESAFNGLQLLVIVLAIILLITLQKSDRGIKKTTVHAGRQSRNYMWSKPLYHRPLSLRRVR